MNGKHVVPTDLHSGEFVGVSDPEKNVQCSTNGNRTTRPIQARRVMLNSYSWELYVVREAGIGRFLAPKISLKTLCILACMPRGGCVRFRRGSCRDQ